MTKYRQVWDLDSLYQDGSKSIRLINDIQAIEERLRLLKESLPTIAISSAEEASSVLTFLIEMGDIKLKLSQVTSFLSCLLAQNYVDEAASAIHNKISNLTSAYNALLANFQAIIANVPLNIWIEILESNVLKDLEMLVTEWRNEAESTLTSNEKAILSSLSTDGYHGWGQLYQTLMGNLEVEVNVEGKLRKYSIGQALNFRSHPDEQVRKIAHESLERKWSEQKDIFAKILNHLAGFRLQMYQLQGIEDVLQEPLRKNRMKKETLEAMWSVVSKHKNPFVQYLKQKGEMNHDDKMQAYNFWAPLSTNARNIDFDDAIDLVIRHFSKFGPKLGEFVITAINKGWIEAENRLKKSAAAFCASFPVSEQSRIFMTYGETMMSVLTLMHELGHAFHNTAMNGQFGLNKQYPLCIAETASTFAEMIVLDGMIKKAETKAEKITLLDEKLKRSVMNFMNIHSRFLFEQTFYEERKKGFVSADRLNELMQEAISLGYEDSIDHVSVYTWLWTPHFYITNAPFYNFPYTFGYLLALSLYAKAKEMGAGFENAYIQLLRDSGKMTTEELIQKHLNEDITKEAFWEKGIKICIEDVEHFLALTAFDEH